MNETCNITHGSLCWANAHPDTIPDTMIMIREASVEELPRYNQFFIASGPYSHVGTGPVAPAVGERMVGMEPTLH